MGWISFIAGGTGIAWSFHQRTRIPESLAGPNQDRREGGLKLGCWSITSFLWGRMSGLCLPGSFVGFCMSDIVMQRVKLKLFIYKMFDKKTHYNFKKNVVFHHDIEFIFCSISTNVFHLYSVICIASEELFFL